MTKWKKQSHVVYQCSYHIVWCPKYRFRILKGQVGNYIENRIRELCEWKKVEILELNVREDHVHMVVEIPPRLSVSNLMGTVNVNFARKLHSNVRDCGTRYIFHKSPHFLGECGGKLFEGKGIKRVGLGFDNLMYLVPIPQKNTFSMEV